MLRAVLPARSLHRPTDTALEVLEAVHDVLHDVCAFSTVKQVDAAAEEADKLQGGKQAAAIQAAEAAGAGPSAAAGAATAAAVATGAAGSGAPAVSGPPGAPGGPPLGHIQSGKYVLPSSGNKTADKVAAGLLTAGTAVAAAVSQHDMGMEPRAWAGWDSANGVSKCHTLA